MEPGHDPRVFGPDARQDAERELDGHVRARRERAGVHNEPPGPWALALSGGGIRSATFCLGLVRGLAGRGLLKHFDYLSTVSGGGYLGASLGRLYGGQAGAAEVEAGVARDDSMWLWWLRNNGRYLTPAGAKDLGYASASILRGVVATNLEIGVLIMALACLVLLPHFLVSLFPPFHEGTLWNHALASTMPSVWGWLLLAPLFACVHQVCAYWYTRDRPHPTSTALIALVAVAGVAASGFAGREALAAVRAPAGVALDPDPIAARLLLAVLALAPATAAVSRAIGRMQGLQAPAQRLLHTKRLSYALWALAIGIALLLLDLATWHLTRLFWGGDLRHAVYRVGGTILVVAAVGRLVLPELQRWMATTKGPSLNLERTLNVVGIALSVLVAVLWTSLLSLLLFPIESREQYWLPGWASLYGAAPVKAFLAVALLCLAWILATRRSFDLLNLASLHNYYRARIERAYVSSGNGGPGGQGRFGGYALDPVTPERTGSIAPLTEAIPGDDVDLDAYRPHAHGGPIHLVNCCLNQSVDDRTGLYNADRKGVAMALSALGVELGTALPEAGVPKALTGRLSQWIAISGAAASTGMGSRTSTGFAALLFMSGMRLGYWTPALLRAGARARDALARLFAFAPKPVAIVAESLARFPGLSSPVWYVSDGGHFDNTGIYALLKRRPEVIVAADCGADPKYLFADLESLVRKAKIDYGATIAFLGNTHGGLSERLRGIVGTPETFEPGLGAQWLVLGRITYSDGSVGALLVVKPRRMDAMPFDMVAYADRHPDFPQQSTGDQFFDEAQWESYHQLGLMMGGRIDAALVADAVAAVHSRGEAASSLGEAEKQSAAAALATAQSERSKRAGLTVRATLGAGLSLSLVVAAWQGIDQYRESRRADQRLYEARVGELVGRIQREPVESLLLDDFRGLAAESQRRGDRRYLTVLERLDQRCAALEDPAREPCLVLHREARQFLTVKPEPFYDYWFADKRPGFIAARAMPAGAVDAMAPRPAAPLQGAAAPEPAAAAAADAPDAGATGAAVERAATASAPVALRPCAPGVTLYVQVYDAQSLPAAREMGARLAAALGARMHPIEDVVASARRRGKAVPFVWPRTTIVYPASSTPACVDLAQAAGGGAGMQAIRYGKKDVFELWVAPRTLGVEEAESQ